MMQDEIRRAVTAHLPGADVVDVVLRGETVRRVYDVSLADDRRLLVKMTTVKEWVDTSAHEGRVTEMLIDAGIALPPVLAVDSSCELLPYPFCIAEHAGGSRLGNLLNRADDEMREELCTTVGVLYARMHSLVGERSGVWVDDPNDPLPVSPNDHMFQAELVDGSGRRALDQGLISATTYDRLVNLWQDALPWLKDHEPRLIHYSAFPWTIYLDEGPLGWFVTKLTALGDTLWWDAACDMAMLRWPPGIPSRLVDWEILRNAYCDAGGETPDPRRMAYYLLLQRVCAAMGVYMAPAGYRSVVWGRAALRELDAIMDAIEGKS